MTGLCHPDSCLKAVLLSTRLQYWACVAFLNFHYFVVYLFIYFTSDWKKIVIFRSIAPTRKKECCLNSPLIKGCWCLLPSCWLAWHLKLRVCLYLDGLLSSQLSALFTLPLVGVWLLLYTRSLQTGHVLIMLGSPVPSAQFKFSINLLNQWAF